MAFTAIHPDAGRIDATRTDLGAGLSWEQVHKVRPRPALRCPDCGHGVHAKVSPRKLRYFAHNPGRPTECAWDNESLEHHLLKLELATAIRDLGWHAELEVRAPDSSWRADVLACSQDGTRRIAWEAQLSPITDADIDERTDHYHQAGIEVCWVGMANRLSWMGVVPSLQVCGPDEDAGPWTVVDGVAGFDYREGSWRVTTASLPEVLGWVLRGRIDFHRVLPRYKRVVLGTVGASSGAPGSGPARAASTRKTVTSRCGNARRRGSSSRPNASARQHSSVPGRRQSRSEHGWPKPSAGSRSRKPKPLCASPSTGASGRSRPSRPECGAKPTTRHGGNGRKPPSSSAGGRRKPSTRPRPRGGRRSPPPRAMNSLPRWRIRCGGRQAAVWSSTRT